jgi:hypothetical protein
VNAERLFHEHVQAGVERGDADGSVLGMGRATENGVDLAGTDHIAGILEAGLAGPFRERRQRFGAAAQRPHLQSGNLSIEHGLPMGATHRPEAD